MVPTLSKSQKRSRNTVESLLILLTIFDNHDYFFDIIPISYTPMMVFVRVKIVAKESKFLRFLWYCYYAEKRSFNISNTTRYCKTLSLGKTLMFVPIITTYSIVARLANQKETKQVT